MDSEDDMHDANDAESLDDFHSGETAMASDDGDGDYEFDNDTDDSDDSALHRQQQNYTILSKADIHQRQEEDITRISTVLCISRVHASILLRHYNWSVSKVHDAWFVDEEKVRKAVGLLEKQVPMANARELTCGICFENYPRNTMNAAACGHQFCSACWTGSTIWMVWIMVLVYQPKVTNTMDMVANFNLVNDQLTRIVRRSSD